MAQYQVKGYRKRTREEVQSPVVSTLAEAWRIASDWLVTGFYKVILILEDRQGEDHPDNAGKFFLYRIIK